MKTFKEFLQEKQFDNIKLYHGTLGYDVPPFKNFNDDLTFFSDDINFAKDYADSKAIAKGEDHNTYIYTCEFTGNLFYVWNMNERYKLYNSLPEELKAHRIFFNDVVSKDFAIDSMRGIGNLNVNPNLKNKEIGDVFSNDTPNDLYTIVDKNENYIWAINNDHLNSLFSKIYYNFEKFKYDEKHEQLKNDFSELREKLKKIANKNTTTDSYIELQYSNKKVWNDLVNEAKKFLIKKLSKYKNDKEYNVYSFNLKNKKVSIKNTWEYFENDVVINILKQMGYDGYIAKEKNVKTYGIFEPNKTINIINVERG